MAKDINQTIQDSRRAAMSFLDAANERERRRNNRNAPGAAETPGAGEAARDLVRKTPGGAKRLSAVDDFMKAGRHREARLANEHAYDIASRIREMSDEEFDEALRSGELTPDEVRKAGEYDWDTWMGDVWSETDWPDTMEEPTYDQFMADPERYGYQRGVNEDDDRAFDRYRRAGSRPVATKTE